MKHLLKEMTLTTPSMILLSNSTQNSPREEDRNDRSGREAPASAQREAQRTASKARKEQKQQARKQKRRKPSSAKDAADEKPLNDANIDPGLFAAPPEASGGATDRTGKPAHNHANSPAEPVAQNRFNQHLRNPMVLRETFPMGGSSPNPVQLPPLPPESRLGSSRPDTYAGSATESNHHPSPADGATFPRGPYTPTNASGPYTPTTAPRSETQNGVESPGGDAKVSTTSFQFLGYFA